LCDLELDPTNLIHDLDLDIMRMYVSTENEVCRSKLSKVSARTGQTETKDRQTQPNVLQRRIRGGNKPNAIYVAPSDHRFTGAWLVETGRVVVAAWWP